MRSATLEELQAAHKALASGTSMATVLTAEWLAGAKGVKVEELPKDEKTGEPIALNYSQTWRFHTRQFVAGKSKCEHCVKALGGKDYTDLAPIADDEAKRKLAVVGAVADGQSWGLISVRLGNTGLANAPYPESQVRREFRDQAQRHDRGLRPAHRGGAFLAKRADLYDDNVALGTRADGYIRKPEDPLPPADAKQVDEATKEQRAKALAARKRAHEATLKKIQAEYAKLIKG